MSFTVFSVCPLTFSSGEPRQGCGPQQGADIIDLGMGNPDLPAPAHVVEKLIETIGKPRTDRYSASKGIPGLRRAQAGYYARRFGVKLNPETQVVATLGSKEGFANVAQAITAPGDVMLVPNPSYPIHAFGFLMAGGVIRSVPAEPTPQFFRRSSARCCTRSPSRSRWWSAIRRTRPPTWRASISTRSSSRSRRSTSIIVLSDLAYAEVYFDDNPPPSMLQVPGAIDVAVEFTSMSKTYLDGRLAHGLRGRQRAHVRGAGAREVLPRLRRLHAGPGGGDGGAERAGRVHRRDARDL